MRILKSVAGLVLGLGLMAPIGAMSAAQEDPQDLLNTEEAAMVAPVYLQLEITSSCDTKGALIRVINRGGKWPQLGKLRLYYADTKEIISERSLRLADGQQVAFVVNHQTMNNRPVAVWIEPSWYNRNFKYDAKVACN